MVFEEKARGEPIAEIAVEARNPLYGKETGEAIVVHVKTMVAV